MWYVNVTEQWGKLRFKSLIKTAEEGKRVGLGGLNKKSPSFLSLPSFPPISLRPWNQLISAFPLSFTSTFFLPVDFPSPLHLRPTDTQTSAEEEEEDQWTEFVHSMCGNHPTKRIFLFQVSTYCIIGRSSIQRVMSFQCGESQAGANPPPKFSIVVSPPSLLERKGEHRKEKLFLLLLFFFGGSFVGWCVRSLLVVRSYLPTFSAGEKPYVPT